MAIFDKTDFWGLKYPQRTLILSQSAFLRIVAKKLPEECVLAMLSRKGVFFWDVVPKIAKSNYVWVILKAKIYFDCRE